MIDQMGALALPKDAKLPPEWPLPELQVSSDEIARWLTQRGLAEEGKPIITLSPGAVGAGKAWPASHYGELARALAKELGVPANRVTEVLRGGRDVTADTAIRLGRYFRTDPRFWLNLQQCYELRLAERRAAKHIARLPKLRRAAPVAAE